jgi:hypothetical protein
MLIGGAARDWWEKRRLQPKVDSIRAEEGSQAAERSRALLLLGTFMIAAGAFTGEAFYGVEAAILAVLDEQIGDIDNWPLIRFSGFVILNAILGAVIYVLFRKAGILGQGGSQGGDGSQGDVMDAELAA